MAIFNDDEPLDITTLKYVLYARKSTVDAERQVRSIPDQIEDCQKMATQLGLNVVKIIRESGSAKKTNQRPEFSNLLIDIQKKKYDAILAWNPDRLARNMLEGGQIINLVDEGILKDLKFKTHYFTNDANGKMLLGMAFVLSKQYSDDLSQKVKRGVDSSLAEGKAWGAKHGYTNQEGYYYPDGHNFELIKEAWQRRKQGQSIESIANWLNEESYHRQLKTKDRKISMATQRLSRVFKDSFYFGVLVQTGKPVDLREVYDFEPAVSEEDYNAVQQLTYFKIKPSKPHRYTFYPLRRMVLCSFCRQPMKVGASKGQKGDRYLYYRCSNKSCSRTKKSIRGKVIINFAYDFLRDGLNFTKQEYDQYLAGMTKLTDQRRQQFVLELGSKRGAIKAVEGEIKNRSLAIIEVKQGSTIWQQNSNRIAELDNKKQELQGRITKIENELAKSDQDALSFEQFLNLSKNASTKLQSDDHIGKDFILRSIWLNFVVDETKVVAYELKEPFKTLLENRKVGQFLKGGDERI